MKRVLFLASLLACSAHSAQAPQGVLQEEPNALPVGLGALPEGANALPEEPNALPEEPDALPVGLGALPEGANVLQEEPNVLPEEPEPGALPGDPSVLQRILMGAQATGIGKIVCNSALTSLPFAVVAYAVRYIPSTPNWLRTSTFAAFVGGASAAVALYYQCLRNRFYVIHRKKDVGTRRNIILGHEITSLDDLVNATEDTPNITLQNVLFLADHKLQSIEGFAFYNCRALKSINIPDEVKTIGSNAFYHCESLKSIISPDGVKTIEADAFSKCSSLEEIVLPGSVTSIERNAFWGCTALRNIHCPETLVRIGGGAFSYCKALKEVNIPGEITRIEDGTFSYCISLRAITWPQNLQHISSEAFVGCNALQEIAFYGDTSVGRDTFRGAENLKKMTFYGNSLSSTLFVGFSHRSVEELVFAACNPEDKVEFLSERFSLFVKDGCTAVFPNGERYVCNTVIWAPEPIAPEPENPEPVDQE